MPKVLKVIRGLSIFIMIVIYAMLVHHVNTSVTSTLLGVILALAPLFLLALTFTAKTTHKLLGVLLILAFFLVAWLLLPTIKQHVALVFWMQDIGLMLILLVTFARTLQQGHKPLCVLFAEMINGGTLPIEHERYARNVTIAWVLFFAGMIVGSTLLFFFAQLATWSIFVNFLTLPLVALMFIVEYIVRRKVLVGLPTGNVLDAVRAYMNNSNRI